MSRRRPGGRRSSRAIGRPARAAGGAVASTWEGNTPEGSFVDPPRRRAAEPRLTLRYEVRIAAVRGEVYRRGKICGRESLYAESVAKDEFEGRASCRSSPS